MISKNILTPPLFYLSILLLTSSYVGTNQSIEKPVELHRSDMFPPKDGKLRLLQGKVVNGRYYAPKNVFFCEADYFGRGTYLAQDALLAQAACVGFYSTEANFKKAEVLFMAGIEKKILNREALKDAFDRFGIEILQTVDHAQGIEILNEEVLEHVSLEAAGPILIEEFLDNCLEVEVDAICDGTSIFYCGIVEHLDPTAVHSGDSICSLPPYQLDQDLQSTFLDQTKKIGLNLGIIGLFNIQFAARENIVMILEVNPRASRTIPLLSKVTGIPLVQIATKCILGHSLKDLSLNGIAKPKFLAIKLPVFPFSRLLVDHEILGPQMKSTRQVLCIGQTFDEAFTKASLYHTNNKFFLKSSKERFPFRGDISATFDVHQVL